MVRNEPVSVLGAWRNAQGQLELDELFTSLGERGEWKVAHRHGDTVAE